MADENLDDVELEVGKHSEKDSLIKKDTLSFLRKGPQRLVAEKDVLKWSLFAVRFAVFADACSSTVLQPNFPFLARTGPGAHPDAFDSTAPFGFASATYFLPMTALLGIAISSAVMGSLSDRWGRRVCILICLGGSIVFLIASYLVRSSFWGFNAVSFVNGLFGGGLPVALAYASDVHPNRANKDGEIGVLIGTNMIGTTGGGIIAILMENEGLFTPLLVGAAINFVAVVILFLFMVDADDKYRFEEDVDEEDMDAPEKIDQRLFWNVVGGALLDNIGSSGFFPMTLAPLAFDIFYVNFLVQGRDPIMSEAAFKWLSVLVALTVIPGAALSEPIFKLIGPAGGCVMGNIITALGTAACILIAGIKPPTKGSFGGFIAFLYVTFPLTVISQLSTGPMLDRLSPPEKRGYAQGISMTVMSFAMAVSPWVYGEMADRIGTNVTLWIAVGVSVIAALVNVPLMFAPALKNKEPINYQKAHDLEDTEMVERATNGEWVPLSFLTQLNDARFEAGKPALLQPINAYQDDKVNFKKLTQYANEDFALARNMIYSWLNDIDSQEKAEEVLALHQKTLPKQAVIEERADDLGKWFTEYMKDAGYFMDGGTTPTLYKQMIMKAFPRLNGASPADEASELKAENMEDFLLRFVSVMNNTLEQDKLSSFTQAFRNSVVWA